MPLPKTIRKKKRTHKSSQRKAALDLSSGIFSNATFLSETNQTESSGKHTFMTLEAMLDKHIEDFYNSGDHNSQLHNPQVILPSNNISNN